MPESSSPPPPDHAAGQLIVHLQRVTQALAAVRRQDEVFGIILNDALNALNGIAGVVRLVEGDHLRVVARRGHDDASVWQDSSLDAHRPGPDALRLNRPLFFSGGGDLVAAYPDLEAETGGLAAVASAVLPMVEGGHPLGVIVLDFKEPHDFTPDEEHFLLTLAGQCALALDRARLSGDLERQVQDRTAELEAFVRFTELADGETDVLTLAAQAEQVLSLLFPGCTNGYYALEDDRWKLKVHSRDLEDNPVLLASIRAGMPLDTPVFAEPMRTGEPVFTDAWDPAREQFAQTEAYQSVGTYPLHVDGSVRVIFALGLKDSPHWTTHQKAVFCSVGRSLKLTLERTETARQLKAQNEELTAHTQALEGVARLTHDLTLSGSPDRLIDQVMQLVLSLLPPGYAAFWQIRDGRWQVRGHRGDVGRAEWQAARERGFQVGHLPTLDQPWQSRRPYFQDRYDPAQDAAPELMDHLLSAATLPVVVRGEVVGVFGVALFGDHQWSRADRALLNTAVQSLGLGLERAAQLQQLEAESAARAAFTAMTESVGTQTDVLVLARQAGEVLRVRFPGASIGYYEREGEVWKASVWTDDLRGDVLSLIRAGLPTQTPMIAQMLHAADAVFIDAWDAQREQLGVTDDYGSVSNYPLMVEGQVKAMLSIGLKDVRVWSEPAKALVRAVGRALTLALERSVTARQLSLQNAELQSRTQALEGFAKLTHDLGLSTERQVLIERALQLVMSLLPAGYALFWQISGTHWQLGAQVGEVGSAELQAVLGAGLPVGQASSLDQPHQTQEALFQDHYDRTLDVDPALVNHVSTVATLPVLVNGAVLGIFTVVLFGQQFWSPAGRAVLLTAAQSLGLALERAEQARALTAQRDMLQASNEELEAFTYSVSHDLRTPVRHIVGFSGLLRRSLPGPLGEKTERYFKIIETAAVTLNELIDGILDLSRTSRQPLKVGAVDLGRLVEAVRKELSVATPEGQITWQIAELPTLMADADLLRRVMMALLSNAVKSTRTRQAAVIEVWAEEQPQHWTVRVRDNGVGFDPQYQDKLFTMFQHLHSQADFGGAGVGLANMRRIITRHGGAVMAEGQPDRGATFSFMLPKVVDGAGSAH